MRFGLVLGTLGISALAAFVACIPNPQGDYDDYLERTKNETAPTNGGGESDASIDTRPPEEAVESLYVGICVTALAARDPNQALRFYTETKFVPDPAGGGKLTMNVAFLRGWDTANNTYTSPTSVSKSETRGATVVVTDAPVAAGDGRFTAVLGTVNLPGEANSVSGRDAVIEDTTLEGRFGGGDRFCSTLGGQLTVPYSFTFDPAANTCLFVKVNEGDPLPAIDSNEFVCAL
jgi:hypothetical protein